MRILLVTPFLPHAAANHGGAVYLSAFAGALATHADVGLVSFATPSELASRPELPAGLRRSWIVARPELTDLTPGGRLLHRARMLERWSARGLPVVVGKFRSKVMIRVLAAAARDFRPDAGLVEMDLLAQYLPCLGAVPTVLTDHEAGDPVPTAIGPHGLGLRRDHRLWERYVGRSYRNATILQALNDEDAAALAARTGRAVAVRPPLVRIPARSVDPASAPPRLLFFGDYRHRPNPEAAVFIATEILPRIRRVEADAELWIAGSHAPPAIEALASLPGVRVVGFVSDLHDLLASSRALLAPVFSGSGSRIKVLTALAHGLPVVGNDLALRGLATPADAARRAESADDLAAATLDWLRDPALAARAGRAARAWAEAAIAPDSVARAQVDAITAMLRT